MVRQAILLVSVEFLINISKEQHPDQHYTFTVANPLPADAQAVGLVYQREGTLGIILESAAFPDVADGGELPILDGPTFTSHYHAVLPPINS